MSRSDSGGTNPAFATRVVHGPSEPGRASRPGESESSHAGERESSRAHAPPIYQTSAFAFDDAASAVRAFREADAWIYTRKGNPTIRALERHVAALEAHPVTGGGISPAASSLAASSPGAQTGAEADPDARFFATGMAAITALAIAVAAGRRLVCQDGIYGTTVAAMERLSRLGIEVAFAPAGDLDALRQTVEAGPPPALVYVETPANPLLQLTDIRAAAEVAHAAGASLAVDATFATPALLRPLAWGADFVVHSTTKFMSGHGVALGGVVSGPAGRLRGELDPVRTELGGAADPFAAWLTLLGLRTLDVRMARQTENALSLARALREHPGVVRVFHPDPDTLPPGQLLAPGPMLSFEVDGDAERALRVIDGLRLATLAPTLGTLDTLVQHPYTMSHAVLPPERRQRLGIGPGLVRVSVGLEHASDLIEDFRRALSA